MAPRRSVAIVIAIAGTLATAAGAGPSIAAAAATGVGTPAVAAAPDRAGQLVTVAATIATGDAQPHYVAVDSTRGLVYFADAAGSALVVYNEATGASKTLDVASDTNGIAVATTSGDAYIPDGNGNVTVVNGSTVLGKVAVGTEPDGDGIAVNQATGYAYVDDEDGTVAVLNGTQVVATVTVGGLPIGGAADSSTGLVYIPDPLDDLVTVIKGTSVLATVPVGHFPEAVDVDPVSHLAYVANSGGADGKSSVSVISGTKHFTVASAHDRLHPVDVTVDPVTGTAYVANLNDTVTILQNKTVLGQPTVGVGPGGISVDPGSAVAIVPSSQTKVLSVLYDAAAVQQIRLAGRTFDSAIDPKTHQAFLADNSGHIYVLQTPATTIKPTPCKASLQGFVNARSARAKARFTIVHAVVARRMCGPRNSPLGFTVVSSHHLTLRVPTHAVVRVLKHASAPVTKRITPAKLVRYLAHDRDGNIFRRTGGALHTKRLTQTYVS